MTHNRLNESHADPLEPDAEGLTLFVENLKIRTIDPPVVVNGKAVRLSELDPAYNAQRLAYLKARGKPLKLRIKRAKKAE